MRKLRPYQMEAVESVFEAWKEHDSTLIVMPTGTGKSVVFSEIIRRSQPKRTLVIAHRAELIFQAVKHVEGTGLEVDIEMADLSASASFWGQRPVVVASVQTLISGQEDRKRMHRFKPEDFGVVIVDEGHHATSSSYVKVLDYFRTNPELRIFGCTATPDRADEQALGQVFKSVSFDFEILDAIHGGWLVPIQQQMVTIEGLDFSEVRTTAGDLNGADLAALMEAEKNMQGVAAASIQIIGNRKTLAFTVSVKQAEILSDIFNRHKPGSSAWVCGMTPKEERRKILADFKDGSLQTVCNCGVLTEGFDDPSVEVVIQARPTKSRVLYSQMVGRGTRPLPGIIDGLDTPEERHKSIAESAKPSMLVVDFVGNSGRHKLVTTADILGGKVSDEAIELAIAKAKKEGTPVRMDRELDKSEEEVQAEIERRKQQEIARKARLVGRATYSAKEVNPFDVLDITPARSRGWDDGKMVSEAQANILKKMGLDPYKMPYVQARQLVAEQFRRWDSKLCSFKQAKILKKYGYNTEVKFEEASRLLDALAKNGWKKPDTESKREPGEEG